MCGIQRVSVGVAAEPRRTTLEYCTQQAAAAFKGKLKYGTAPVGANYLYKYVSYAV